jgi:hypothetical protein
VQPLVVVKANDVFSDAFASHKNSSIDAFFIYQDVGGLECEKLVNLFIGKVSSRRILYAALRVIDIKILIRVMQW